MSESRLLSDWRERTGAAQQVRNPLCLAFDDSGEHAKCCILIIGPLASRTHGSMLPTLPRIRSCIRRSSTVYYGYVTDEAALTLKWTPAYQFTATLYNFGSRGGNLKPLVLPLAVSTVQGIDLHLDIQHL
jgi:hypothetical protein